MKNHHTFLFVSTWTMFFMLFTPLIIGVHAEMNINVQTLPAPKYEVRGVWLTTISNLDWPKSRDVQRQKEELIEILDKLKDANFNTVFLQTRIRGTVIYPSDIEPWDGCFTGKPGKSPGYDPLKFAIDACHERGLELHAWVVAFPGHNFNVASALGSKAMNKRISQLCVKTDKFWMLNPAESRTASYIASICSEIVKNYDVDGIHLDYIRYPESSVRFSDAATFRKQGSGKTLNQWRRDNVTRCVREIHHAIKDIKPWVRLSCSPIGKFRDTDKFSSRGWNAYETGAQDAQGWLKEGIMDMVVPMMYFKDNQFYPFAFDWKENSNGRIVVPGLGPYLMKESGWPLQTITQEVSVLRLADFEGQTYFRTQHTLNDKGLYDFLKKSAYVYPAFTPPLTWDCRKNPSSPQNLELKETSKGINLEWDVVDGDNSLLYNVYVSDKFPVDVNNIEHLIVKGLRANSYHLDRIKPSGIGPYYAVTAMNRYGVESKPASFNHPDLYKASQNQYRGNIHISDNVLYIDTNIKAPFIILVDEAGRIVQTMKYTKELPLQSLTSGVYTVRTLQEHGKSICLGMFEWGY